VQKEILVRIEDINEKGYGIGRIADTVIEVPKALPNELVFVKLGRKKRARIVSIVEEDPSRTNALCPYVGFCGGCFWQNVKYTKQLELKQRVVDKIYSNIRGDFEIRKIIPSKKIFGYRGKMEFIFSKGRSSIALGLREYGHYDRIVDIFSCWLQSQKANTTMAAIRSRLAILGYEPYNIKTHDGFLRYLVMRSSFYNGEVLVIIITSSQNKLSLEYLVENFDIDNVVWAINDSLSDVATGEVKEVYGRGAIYEKALGYLFKVYPFSFYQSNPTQARVLFRLTKELGGYGDRALDLYCGIGTISIIISENFNEVIGIEVEETSIKAANENKKMNDVNNVQFIVGKVEEKIREFRDTKIDVVFVDPPRPGIHKTALEVLSKLGPSKIVYVSCNPRTQAKDVAFLLRNGYELEIVQPMDMLPHTPHVETIAVLNRKEK